MALMPRDMHYLDTNPKMILKKPKFFKQLSELLQITPERTITNYALIRYVMDCLNELDKRFKNIKQAQEKKSNGQEKSLPRWKECIDLNDKKMKYASGSLYVRKHFPKSDLKIAKKITENLRLSFKKSFQKLEWMPSMTLDHAIKKVSQLLVECPKLLFSSFRSPLCPY